MADIFSKEEIEKRAANMNEEAKKRFIDAMEDIKNTVDSQIRFEEPEPMEVVEEKLRSGEYKPFDDEEFIKKYQSYKKPPKTHKGAGDIFTYIFYYPLKSIVSILKVIFEILRVVSIPAFFGGCFCLYKYFSEHPKEWYYQLWFGIVLVVSPFVVNAIYFVLCQIKVKLLMRLATNKHVINRIDSL